MVYREPVRWFIFQHYIAMRLGPVVAYTRRKPNRRLSAWIRKYNQMVYGRRLVIASTITFKTSMKQGHKGFAEAELTYGIFLLSVYTHFGGRAFWKLIVPDF